MLHVLWVHMPMAHVHVVCSIQKRMFGSNSAVRWMSLGGEHTAIGDMSQLGTWYASTAFPGRSLVFHRCTWVHRRVGSPQGRSTGLCYCMIRPEMRRTVAVQLKESDEGGSTEPHGFHFGRFAIAPCLSKDDLVPKEGPTWLAALVLVVDYE